MFLWCPWAPGLLAWQQLWLLVLVALFPERLWILPTTEPPEPTEPLPDLLPELSNAFTAQPQLEGFGNPASSAPSQGSAPPLESPYRNKLKKLYFLQSWLDAEIQGKIKEIKKKEKTAVLMQSSLSSSKFQIVPKKLASVQAQVDSLAEDQRGRRRLRTVDLVLKGPKGIRRRLLKGRRKQKVREEHSAPPLVENTAGERGLSSPSTGKPGQNEGALRRRNPFRTERKAPASSSLQGPLLGRSPTSTSANTPWRARNRVKDLTGSILLLEHTGARVKSKEGTQRILDSQKSHRFHKTHSLVAHRTPQPNLRVESAHQRRRGTGRPLLSALRSLLHPTPGALSRWADPHVQENPSSELHAPAEPSAGSTAAENQAAGNASERSVFTTNPPISATHCAMTALSPKSTGDHVRAAHGECPGASSDPPHIDLSPRLLLSPGDQFENQQLRALISNKEVRRLISSVIRTLKMDCSEPHMRLACAKLISRTGLLMQLLREQQDAAAAQAQTDAEQRQSEAYASRSTAAPRSQKGREPWKVLTREVAGYDYRITIGILLVIIMTVVMFWNVLSTESSCRRPALEEDEDGCCGGIFHQRRKCSADREGQQGFSSWFWRSLWLRDMDRPFSVTRQQSMAQKLYDKDSSGEDTTATSDTGAQ